MPRDARDFDLYTVLAITHRLPERGDRYAEIVARLAGAPMSPPQVAHDRGRATTGPRALTRHLLGDLAQTRSV